MDGYYLLIILCACLAYLVKKAHEKRVRKKAILRHLEAKKAVETKKAEAETNKAKKEAERDLQKAIKADLQRRTAESLLPDLAGDVAILYSQLDNALEQYHGGSNKQIEKAAGKVLALRKRIRATEKEVERLKVYL